MGISLFFLFYRGNAEKGIKIYILFFGYILIYIHGKNYLLYCRTTCAAFEARATWGAAASLRRSRSAPAWSSPRSTSRTCWTPEWRLESPLSTGVSTSFLFFFCLVCCSLPVAGVLHIRADFALFERVETDISRSNSSNSRMYVCVRVCNVFLFITTFSALCIYLRIYTTTVWHWRRSIFFLLLRTLLLEV